MSSPSALTGKVRLWIASVCLLFPALSGCLWQDAPDPLACPETSSDDWHDVGGPIKRKWLDDGKASYPSDKVIYLALTSLRTDDPEVLEGSGGGYVDWVDYDMDERPEIVHDALCLAEWRIENLENLTTGDFQTRIPSATTVVVEARDALAVERDRQHGEIDGYCCYILFRDQFHGITLLTSHQTG